MSGKQKREIEFGQKMTSKWFAKVPKWLRYIVIFGGLILLGYFVNKGVWF